MFANLFTNLDPDNVMAIIAIAAVFSPIITALINSMFTLINKCIDNHQKNHENSYLHKREILENYVKSLELCLWNPITSNQHLYNQSYGVALMYVPEHIRKKMVEINELITSQKFNDAKSKAIKLIPLIAHYAVK